MDRPERRVISLYPIHWIGLQYSGTARYCATSGGSHVISAEAEAIMMSIKTQKTIHLEDALHKLKSPARIFFIKG